MFGFVADTDSGNVGVSAGDAVTSEFGALLNSEPSLSSEEGITVTSSGTIITVQLDGMTPPVTPSKAVIMTHTGRVLATVSLAEFSGHFSGSAPGMLLANGVYYVRIEGA